jgi:uncharacterized alkaline shock family protein YloU
VEQPGLSISAPRGRITISPEAVAQIAGRTIAECYGVVDTSPPARARVRRLWRRDRETLGISVAGENGAVTLDVYVVVEHGLNLAEVAGTIRSQVGYDVERLTGLRVDSVNVHIRDVRRSA